MGWGRGGSVTWHESHCFWESTNGVHASMQQPFPGVRSWGTWPWQAFLWLLPPRRSSPEVSAFLGQRSTRWPVSGEFQEWGQPRGVRGL